MKGLHANQPVFTTGAALKDARQVVLMVHGRGASAHDILSLAQSWPEAHTHTAFIAPQAANHVWYPLPYSTPIQQNQPWFADAMHVLDALVETANAAGVPTQRIALLGFSQGAVLSLEYALRHPRQYAGVFALSGALMSETLHSPPAADLQNSPVFLGCSDVDNYFPIEHIHATAHALHECNALVTKRIYSGMGHTVNEDELGFINTFLIQN
jgi:phospholipase/carboxylesterase